MDYEFGNRKLAHYNAWLLDPNRESGKPYPGFPEELKLIQARARLAADVAEKSAKKAKAYVRTAKDKAVKAGSKIELAVAIYKRLNGDKVAVIAAIQAEAGMSLAGATTYFYNAKKLA